MRVLIAITWLLLAVAEAFHNPDHVINYPRFQVGYTHVYELFLNATAGVLGLSPQVSKVAQKMDVKIFAQSEKVLIISIEKYSSADVSAIASDSEPIALKADRRLEHLLNIPIKVVLEKGKVESYTLDPNESLLSQKIKRSVLRQLELDLDSLPDSSEEQQGPLRYNITRKSPVGDYVSQYIITESPFPDFPKERNVYNVTRYDEYENISYIAYWQHDNFIKKEHPEFFPQEDSEEYDRVRPINPQLHQQSPIKLSFTQQHNLITKSDGIVEIDSVRTYESHLAHLYDQKMLVLVSSLLSLKQIISENIPEPVGQLEFQHLPDIEEEINEEEIREVCHHPKPSENIQIVKKLLDEISDFVIRDEIKEPKYQNVGEKLVLLQKAAFLLKEEHLKVIQDSIKHYDDLIAVSEQDKIKRQIWLDILPLIGSNESVSFIVQLIKDNANPPSKVISLWEAKEILEALPENIHEPDEEILIKLKELLEIVHSERDPAFHFFHSAVHLAVSRVINRLYINHIQSEDESSLRADRLRVDGLRADGLRDDGLRADGLRADGLRADGLRDDGLRADGLRADGLRDDGLRDDGLRADGLRFFLRAAQPRKQKQSFKSLEESVQEFIQDIGAKLLSTNDKAKRVIYIEALVRSGLVDVLPYIAPFVHGRVPVGSPKYINFIKSVAIYALHNLVVQHPKEVLDLVVPVFFNETENHKIRTAAFGVLIRARPSLSLLTLIADQSWKEESEEVGSFVTSILESHGNSSLPRDQEIADRIKKILPLVKKFDKGQQHAKKVLHSYYDKLREFGVVNELEITPSNESFIPASLYAALGYNLNSLSDVISEFALNIEGLNSRSAWDSILRLLKLKPAEEIPKSVEEDIFSEVNLAEKDPESWRLTIFKKLFYVNSYYYLDEESIKGNLVNIMRDYLSHHLNLDYIGNLEGRIVKVFIPSSYHTKAVSKVLPVPVGFEINSPLLLSLKIKAKKAEIESPQGRSYILSVKPSVHHSVLHSNQILDLRDCKQIGVYHERKISASYPIELKLAILKHGNLSLAYSFPELPKKILSYHSEAGTYAAKWDGETPLSMKARKSIQTIPVQFKKEKEIGVLGLPKFRVKVLTEDLKEGREEIPRNQHDLAHLLIKKLLNAGWRKKTVEIERVADSKFWPSRAEVQLNVSLERNFVEHSVLVREEDWAKKVNLRDKSEAKDPKDYAEEAKYLVKLIDQDISHMNETLIIDFVQINSGRIVFALHVNASYRYTFGGCIQHLHVDADLKQHRLSKHNEASFDYYVAFLNRPHEFSYDKEHFGKQKAVAFASLSLSKSGPFEDVVLAAKALLSHKSLEDLLHDELLSPKLSELDLPKSHKQCIHDVREGDALSVACVKAIKEASIYNDLYLDIILRKAELPPEIFDLLIKVELATKFAFFPHLEVQIKRGISRVRWPYLRFHSIIIDKLVDKPVVDIIIEKPDEILKLHKVELGPIQPISSIEPLVDTYLRAYSNNTYPASCIITEKQVKTYDAKVYQLPKDAPEYTYIVSAHSIEHKKFAVLAKLRPGSNAIKEVHLFIGADVVVLSPPSRRVYNLKHNEANVPIRLLKSKVLNWEAQLHAFAYPLVDGHVVLEVHAHVAGIKVTYDGKHLKLKIHPRYKGELSGLCSEFDGDVVREFVGVDGCLYSDSDDFVKSAIVDHDVDRRPEHPVICEHDEILHRNRGKQYSPRMRRNLVLAKGDELCFSVKPVPMCDNQAEPQETKQEKVKFHCLPKRDVAARRMVTESKRRILGELEAKPADLSQTVSVAKMC